MDNPGPWPVSLSIDLTFAILALGPGLLPGRRLNGITNKAGRWSLFAIAQESIADRGRNPPRGALRGEKEGCPLPGAAMGGQGWRTRREGVDVAPSSRGGLDLSLAVRPCPSRAPQRRWTAWSARGWRSSSPPAPACRWDPRPWSPRYPHAACRWGRCPGCASCRP